MVLVRLQVHVLPWQDSTPANGVAPPRQELILPWNEPCDENATIQTLSENIVARFKSIHVGKGDLNIKYLQDFWGSLLDMTTTVGQTFIDRAFGVDISNSIVKVVRFPPTPSELENPLRCASLAPESSARPRKRGFEEFTEDLQAKLRRAAYGKHYGPEQLTSSQSVNKRQRKQGRDLDDADNRVRPIHLSGISENIALQTSLQNSILQQSSSILGNDSQRSPGTKRRNPYGSPLPFSHWSPQGLVSFIQRGHVAIPDSPPSRRTSFTEQPSFPTTTELELGNAKSESPELNSSVHELSNTARSSKGPEMKDLDDGATEIRHHVASAAPRLPSLKLDQVKAKATDTERQEKSPSQAVISEVGSSSTKPKFRPPVPARRTRSNEKSATSLEARDMFDPIDTESEKSQELRYLRSVKRLKGNGSLPSKSPGDHQSPYQEVLHGKSIIPSTLKPRPKLPADPQLRDFDGHNGPSSLANILNQTSSQARDVQEISNDSVEATPGQNRPQSGPRVSNNQADIANEPAVVFNMQIPSTPVNVLNRDIQRVHTMEVLPPLPQTEFSTPQSSSKMIQEPSIENSVGKEMETDRPNDIGDESIDLSPSHDLKEKGSDELEALAKVEDMKAPGKPYRGEKSKSKKPVEEISVAKGAEKEAENMKLAEGVEQEIARRKKVLREKRGDVIEAKLSQEKEKSIKPKDGKARKSKSRGEKAEEVKSSGKKSVTEGAKSKTVRAAKPEKEKAMMESLQAETTREAAIKTNRLTLSTTSPPRRQEARSNEATTETEVPDADEGRSGLLKPKGLSKKPDLDKSITLKSNGYTDAQSRSSATSNSRNDSIRSRKSMTPAFPGSSLSKPELLESKSSVRTPSRHITHPDSLLRSETVRPPSTASRPVAVSKDPSSLSSYPESTAETPAETDRKGVNNDLMNGKPRGSSKTKQESKSESYAGTSKKSKDKAIKDEKTQTKLNVSRDVKGKGRLDDPPVRPKAELQEPIILDSESEESNSSFSPDDDDPQMRIGKAGPSRKRKGPSHVAPSKEKASAKDLSTASIGKSVDKLAETTGNQASPAKDQAAKVRGNSLQESDVKTVPKTSTAVKAKTEEPRPKTIAKKATQGVAKSRIPAIKTEKVIEEQAPPPSRIIDPKIHATLPSSHNSSPRAPAQYMSNAVSISSDSSSDAGSGSQSESGSESESESDADASNLPPTQLKSDQMDGTASQPRTEMNANNGIVAQEVSLTNLAKSNESHIFSKRTPEREADEQLQRETRQSIRPRLRSASSISSQPVSDEEPTLSHPSVIDSGSVESRLRPSNCPYPSMTELREKRSEKMKSQLRTHGLVPMSTSNRLDPKVSPLTEAPSTSSSSSSEDDSDSDRSIHLETSKVATQGANHNSPDSKTTAFKTMKRILRVADKVKFSTGPQR